MTYVVIVAALETRAAMCISAQQGDYSRRILAC